MEESESPDTSVTEKEKEFKEETLSKINKKEDKMVKVKIWVPGYWKKVGRKRIRVKGHYKYIDVPIWKMSSFGRKRRR